jgi:NAD-dependent deacetylase sirtuin 4
MPPGQLMRIPYTAPLPAPTIFPSAATSLSGAIAALTDFLTSTPQKHHKDKTVLLTGAGISVASGLADYRGTKGTYTLNKTYRPIYFHEFVANHAARKRYWARSFLGWTNLNKSKPNAAHKAVADLGRMGYLSSVITQSITSKTWKLVGRRTDIGDNHRRRFFPPTSSPVNPHPRVAWIPPQRSLHNLPHRIRPSTFPE